MTIATFDDLLEENEETETVTLGNGKQVVVRGLTRHELLLCGKDTQATDVIERRMVRYALVEPKLTEAQAEKWQKVAKPRDVGLVVDALRRLSGLADDAPKSGVPEDGDN